MAPPRKTIQQYEVEAVWQGDCLVSPRGCGVARKVYILRHGTLPSHIAVCHKCDNPKCIADKHHFKGTWADNVHDSVKKGRHSCFRKGGIRFGGKHTLEAKAKIGAASKKMWAKRSKKKRAEIARKIHASQTPAKLRARALKTWRTRRALQN